MNNRDIQTKNYTLEALRSLCDRGFLGEWEYEEASHEYHYSLRIEPDSHKQIRPYDQVNYFESYLDIPPFCATEELSKPGSFRIKYSEKNILKSPVVSKTIEELKMKDINREIDSRKDITKKQIVNAFAQVLNKLCKGIVLQDTHFISVMWSANNEDDTLSLSFVVNEDDEYDTSRQMLVKAICEKVGMNDSGFSLGEPSTQATEHPSAKRRVVNLEVNVDGMRSLYDFYPVLSELHKELNKKPSNILPLVTGIGGGVMLGVGIATGGLALAIAGGIVMLGSFIKAIWNCSTGRPGFFRRPVEAVDVRDYEDRPDTAFSA